MLKEERLHQMLLASIGMDSLQNEAKTYADKYENPRITELLQQFGKLILTIAGHGVALNKEYGVDPGAAYREYLEELKACEDASREWVED